MKQDGGAQEYSINPNWMNQLRAERIAEPDGWLSDRTKSPGTGF
jgi:hypothetical protein